MSFTETTTTTKTQEKKNLTQIEEKLQIKLENSKSFLLKSYHQCQSYWNAIKFTFESLWDYPEFRLGVYIFGLLSVIPAALFLLFISLVVFCTTVLASFVWAFFVFSALAIGLMILVPILFGCSIIVGFLIVGYDVYQYLLRLKQANNKPKSN